MHNIHKYLCYPLYINSYHNDYCSTAPFMHKLYINKS